MGIAFKSNAFYIYGAWYEWRTTEKNLQNFVNELNEYIPMLDNYEQSTLDKIVRRLKL